MIYAIQLNKNHRNHQPQLPLTIYIDQNQHIQIIFSVCSDNVLKTAYQTLGDGHPNGISSLSLTDAPKIREAIQLHKLIMVGFFLRWHTLVIQCDSEVYCFRLKSLNS